MEQKRKALFSVIFGDSDSDDDDSPPHTAVAHEKLVLQHELHLEVKNVQNWEMVENVPGLWLSKQFLSPLDQQLLFTAIGAEGWFSDPLQNQVMRFGDLPGWALDLSERIRGSVFSSSTATNSNKSGLEDYPEGEKAHGYPHAITLPAEILHREPLFDQMIVNSYQPGEGIAAHVDLLRFKDGIVVVSLISTCVMTFRPSSTPICAPENSSVDNVTKSSMLLQTDVSCRNMEDDHSRCSTEEVYKPGGDIQTVPVLLEPGDLLFMHGEARYRWTHEINRNGHEQVWQGKPVDQQQRISVTLRCLCPS